MNFTDKYKKECSVCKKIFEPCTCKSWRTVVCCPEHFIPHATLVTYRDKKIDKTTAKKELEDAIERFGEIDFNDNVQALVDEILTEKVEKAPIIEKAQSKKFKKK